MRDKTEFFDKLHELVKKLNNLLDNRKPVSLSWNVAVSSLVHDIIDLWRKR